MRKFTKPFMTLVLIGVIMSSFLAACKTETPEPTATDRPTRTPRPSPTS